MSFDNNDITRKNMFSVAIGNFHSDHFLKSGFQGLNQLSFTLQPLSTLDTGLNHIYIMPSPVQESRRTLTELTSFPATLLLRHDKTISWILSVQSLTSRDDSLLPSVSMPAGATHNLYHCQCHRCNTESEPAMNDLSDERTSVS